MRLRGARIVARTSRGAPVTDFALLAMVSTWMEGDIVEAAIANARAQGCDAVYVLDDGSPDDTVALAERAGAVVLESASNERWEPSRTRALRQAHATRLALEHGREHTWWLFLDADELPQGTGGRTVREHVSGLDRRTRAVGSLFFNHLPSGTPANLPGFHPGDCQPLMYRRAGQACAAGHFKHQLLRFDRGAKPLEVGYGSHRVKGARRVVEATDSIQVHHFQYRDEATTRKRLAVLETRMTDGSGRQIRPGRSAWARVHDVDAVYQGDWDHVRNDGTREMGVADVLRPADELLAPEDARLQTWYSAEALASARDASR